MCQVYSCKNCVPPIRHEGCHSTCEKYLAEKEANEAEKQLIKENKRPHELMRGVYHERDVRLSRRGICGYT